MAVDYAEKEREFLESLAADTGRDLAGWMAAIAQTQLSDRNAIIDWLRQQGFLFARASWLERIHNNGGRPIYVDPAVIGAATVEPQARPPVSPAAVPGAAPPRPAPVATPPRPIQTAVSAPPRTAAQTKSSPPSLDALLSEAKGYRPLAQLVLREIERAAPRTTFEARNGYVALLTATGSLSGVLTIAAKELRLALALGDRAPPVPFTKAKFPKSAPEIPPEITHMVILEDARQVTPDLVAAVVENLGAR